jgi:hypothetical protein
MDTRKGASMQTTNDTGSERRATRGFFPVVAGRNVHVERGGGVLFLALEQLVIERGGGQWMISAGDLHVNKGGGAALIARSAHIEHGRIGVLVARDIHLGSGTRVTARINPAALAVTVAAFATGWWLSARRHS